MLVVDYSRLIQFVYSVTCQMARGVYKRDARSVQVSRDIGVDSWASPLRGQPDPQFPFLAPCFSLLLTQVRQYIIFAFQGDFTFSCQYYVHVYPVWA